MPQAGQTAFWTKYRLADKAGDVEQIVAYAQTLPCQRVALISPREIAQPHTLAVTILSPD